MSKKPKSVMKQKAVVFNMDDPAQVALLEYVTSKSSNFSNYVKLLIYKEMHGLSNQTTEQDAVDEVSSEGPKLKKIEGIDLDNWI